MIATIMKIGVRLPPFENHQQITTPLIKISSRLPILLHSSTSFGVELAIILYSTLIDSNIVFFDNKSVSVMYI
jgi:hypothetical protein